jgi:hypothetical protein
MDAEPVAGAARGRNRAPKTFDKDGRNLRCSLIKPCQALLLRAEFLLKVPAGRVPPKGCKRAEFLLKMGPIMQREPTHG